MKYLINYDRNTIHECEIVEQNENEIGLCYTCLVFDKKLQDEMEVEVYDLYDNREEALKALNEIIDSEMESSSYAAGYDYACGYYD